MTVLPPSPTEQSQIFNKKAVLSQGEPCDAAVNFDMYQILQQVNN